MDYLDRLEQDYKDICDKKGALSHFLEYVNHENLNNGEVGLLRIQYSIMASYLDVLQQRLKLREKTLGKSNIGEMEEGKTIVELYTKYINGERAF